MRLARPQLYGAVISRSRGPACAPPTAAAGATSTRGSHRTAPAPSIAASHARAMQTHRSCIKAPNSRMSSAALATARSAKRDPPPVSLEDGTSATEESAPPLARSPPSHQRICSVAENVAGGECAAAGCSEVLPVRRLPPTIAGGAGLIVRLAGTSVPRPSADSRHDRRSGEPERSAPRARAAVSRRRRRSKSASRALPPSLLQPSENEMRRMPRPPGPNARLAAACDAREHDRRSSMLTTTTSSSFIHHRALCINTRRHVPRVER